MKIPAIAITAVVVITVLAGVLMPVLDDATATEDTFTNEGLINAKKLDAGSNTTITWDSTNPKVLTVDDSEIDLSNTSTPYAALTFLFSKDWFVRLAGLTNTPSLNVFKCDTNSSAAVLTVSNGSVSIFIDSGSATITSGSTSLTYDVDGDGLVITPNSADYVVKYSGDAAYISSESVIYGAGRTDRALGAASTSFNVIFSATIEEFTPLYYSPQYTFADEESINSVEISTHKDLYQIKGVTFNLVSGGVNHPVTYNQIFVPSEITSERSVHFDDNQNAIFAAIPIMVIIALLIAVVAMVFRSRQF